MQEQNKPYNPIKPTNQSTGLIAEIDTSDIAIAYALFLTQRRSKCMKMETAPFQAF